MDVVAGTSWIAIVIGCIIAYISFVLVRRYVIGGSRGGGSVGGGRSVLLVGASDAGKTAMFMRLKNHGSAMRDTVASMKPNEGVVSMRVGDVAKEVHCIDLPGHPRLGSYFEREVSKARAIVVVVDSMEFNAAKDEVAGLMYKILTSPVVRGRGLPILVACNKSDGGVKAHSVDFIRKRLEKLIYEIYTSHTGGSGLESIGNEVEREHNILTDGESFSFSDLATRRKFHRPIHVSFEKVSVKEDDLDAVKKFCLNNV